MSRRVKRVPKRLEGLNLDFVDKIYYINLDDRKDRLENIVKQVGKVDPGMKKSERVSAVRRNIGIIGCGESHVKTLQRALDEGHETVLVFEDDFEFEIDPEQVKTILTKFLNSHPNYNVFCLGRRLLSGRRLPTGFVEATDCQTTSCYMVRRHFIPKLIEVFQESVDELNRGMPTRTSALDIKWKILQTPGGEFYTTEEKIGKQMRSFSDIENQLVDYGC